MKSNNNSTLDHHWQQLVNALPEAVLILDFDGHIIYANQVACALFSKRQSQLVGSHFSYPYGTNKPAEIEILKPDNHVIYADMVTQKGAWENKEAWIVTLHDITQRKKETEKLIVSANVFKFAKEGIVITNKHLNIIDVNAEFSAITGYDKSEVIGQKISLLQSGRHDQQFYKKMWDHIQEHHYWQGVVWNKKKNQQIFPQLLVISKVTDGEQNIISYVGIFYDITKEEEQKSQLERLALYDPVTNLSNRAHFITQLESAMQFTRRNQCYLAVAFIDLDDFKQLNDQHGHLAGDLALKTLGKLLQSAARQTDVVARYGGDEFVLFMTSLHCKKSYKAIIDRVYAALQQPLIIENHKIKLTLSIGLTFYPQSCPISSEQLIRQADQAMYKSKVAGKNCVSLFDTNEDILERSESELVHEIEAAHKQSQLVLFYQPKVDMKNKKVFGAEALLRWHHPTKGLIYPHEVFPVLKNHHFLHELSHWTIKQSLDQIQSWQNIGKQLSISVNIDALHLEQESFMSGLKSLLKNYPSTVNQNLELEILESTIISDVQKVKKIIQHCNELGIKFSLDDFGTGYSSISYLKQLPFSYMKIDMNFIRNILNNSRDIKILQAILQLAKAINIEVIAEGVETPQHVKLLLAMGCDLGQGYAFSKALPADDFIDWLETQAD